MQGYTTESETLPRPCQHTCTVRNKNNRDISSIQQCHLELLHDLRAKLDPVLKVAMEITL